MQQHFRTTHPPTAQTVHARDPKFCMVGLQGFLDFVLEGKIWAHLGVFGGVKSKFKNPLGSTMQNLGSLACSVWAVGGGGVRKCCCTSYIRRNIINVYSTPLPRLVSPYDTNLRARLSPSASARRCLRSSASKATVFDLA